MHFKVESAFYDEHGAKDFDEFDDDYVIANDIAVHGMAIQIREWGLREVLVRCKIPEQNITLIIDYIRDQLLREDLTDIIGIGPSINRELKQWVSAGMPDHPVNPASDKLSDSP